MRTCSVICPVHTPHIHGNTFYIIAHGLTYNASSDPSAFVPHPLLLTNHPCRATVREKPHSSTWGDAWNACSTDQICALATKRHYLFSSPKPLAKAEPLKPVCRDLARRWQCRTRDQGLWAHASSWEQGRAFLTWVILSVCIQTDYSSSTPKFIQTVSFFVFCDALCCRWLLFFSQHSNWTS